MIASCVGVRVPIGRAQALQLGALKKMDKDKDSLAQ